MKKIKIGIAINEIQDAGDILHNLPISYIPSGYVKAVQNAGGLPILLPISSPQDATDYVSSIDKLILAGGQNVNPEYYNEQPIFDKSLMHNQRDSFELALIDEAFKQKKPILAICRGMQLLNVKLGGTLFQDISQDEVIKHMQAPLSRELLTHDVITEYESVLNDLYGDTTKVNSFHFQSIKLLGKNVRVTAKSQDEIIEGIESEDNSKRFIGVQWHPDFVYNTEEKEQKLFNYFVASF
ncbi:gamma-glutamyl-gamma-aminobutyrate hydrolase family protein [Vagococcus vulneris]|uniref:Gamma-glutamyl-gamma-aminobutyrate hydrolase n=1 Tax=Vagococcus vulneris TaxID=1977869 RepID=A0A430A228_9ENTE|nr:gamma-glutamyl-gamma-aminobutyrate hydrolase family protein [Vagococcus vulneris]RSU00457.1 gamma-glutamyl-gamma-aminobutyrate hydrolase [Vagococcus vulneris]